MIKNTLQLEYLRQAGKVVADIYNHLKTIIKPGVTGLEVDAIVEEMIYARGARPAFKNYVPMKGMPPFPSSICWSINEEVIHGLPNSRVINDGDVVSVDMGVELNGYYGDSAYTFLVGNV
ncbi:MAG: M24 family metallopeptidase, partial [Brevinema sp.]